MSAVLFQINGEIGELQSQIDDLDPSLDEGLIQDLTQQLLEKKQLQREHFTNAVDQKQFEKTPEQRLLEKLEIDLNSRIQKPYTKESLSLVELVASEFEFKEEREAAGKIVCKFRDEIETFLEHKIALKDDIRKLVEAEMLGEKDLNPDAFEVT